MSDVNKLGVSCSAYPTVNKPKSGSRQEALLTELGWRWGKAQFMSQRSGKLFDNCSLMKDQPS